MLCEFVGTRVSAIRQGMAHAGIGHDARLHVERLLATIEEGAFCFRVEPWHNVGFNGGADACVNEMLLHLLRHDQEKINMCWAISEIYEAGFSKEFDSMIVALVAQQAEAQGAYPVAINVSPESACNRSFWEECGPFLNASAPENFIFELLEEDYIPSSEGRTVLIAAQNLGFRFALDDIENCPRDERRLQCFGDIVDFIKIDGSLVEQWELGVPGLISFMDRLRRRTDGPVFIAEWVSSVAKARFLAEMGFNAVQGRCLPVSREEFLSRFTQTPAHLCPQDRILTDTFADALMIA